MGFDFPAFRISNRALVNKAECFLRARQTALMPLRHLTLSPYSAEAEPTLAARFPRDEPLSPLRQGCRMLLDSLAPLDCGAEVAVTSSIEKEIYRQSK